MLSTTNRHPRNQFGAMPGSKQKEYMMGPFGLTYARLVEHGYAVLPIMPGTKKPGLPTYNNSDGNEKWMDFPRWTSFQSTLVHHKHWALSTAGIGILLGPRSGDVVGIDNDSDDPRIAEALRSVLPETPVRKKGAKGDTGFYRGPGIRSHAWMIDGRKVVEILGTGRQTVLPPTIHPGTGEPYRWTGTKTLEELRPEELPLLPPDIIARIDAVLAPFGYVPPPLRGRTSRDGLGDEIDASDDPHRRLNEAALDNLSAWVPALDLYRCRPYRQGFEAVATWRPSTEGRKLEDRNRNLKIARSGIKDFGANQGYTAIDLVMAAQECDLETAFAFLDEHLEWSGGEPLLDTSLDVSALDTSLDSSGPAASSAASSPKLEMLGLEPDDADSNGSSHGSSNGNSHGNGAGHTGAYNGGMHAGGMHNGGAHNGGAQASTQFKPEAPSIVPSIPPWRLFQESENDSEASSTGTPIRDPQLELLTHVPGLVGEITDHIVNSARRPNRVFALGAAISVVGTLPGRRARGPTESTTNLYVTTIGPSGTGKEHPLECIQPLLKAAGAGCHVHASDFSAQKVFNQRLIENPLTIAVIDEFAGFLSRIVSPKSGAWERQLVKQLSSPSRKIRPDKRGAP
jgi:hypothetical protein